MDDYWSLLPLDVKMSKKKRFNYVMTAIKESAAAAAGSHVEVADKEDSSE